MKLKDCRDAYYLHTGKASDICRQLGFAGIALIWIFKVGTGDKSKPPEEMLLPLLLIFLTLLFDFLHYVIAGAIWGFYGNYKERKGTQANESFKAPGFINWPAIGLFWFKIVSMVVAYFFILRFLYQRWIV